MHWFLCTFSAVLAVASATITVAPVTAQGNSSTPQPTATEKFILDKPIPLGTPGVSARVSVASFKVGQRSHTAWFYRTSGMWDLKQPEFFALVLKNKGDADQSFPSGPLKLFAGLARPGRPEAFSEIDYSPYNCFPGSQFSGMIFVRYDGLEGISLEHGGLGCVAINPEEFDVCKAAGSTRVKAALAHQATYYPCPVWSDLSRKSVFSSSDVADMKEEPIIKSMPSFGSFASVLLSNKEFSFRLGADEGKLIAKSLEKYKGILRVSLTYDPRATAFLVWAPKGAKAQAAVGPPPPDLSKMSGEFLALVGGAKRDAVTQVNDGYMLELTGEAIDKFRLALSQGSEFTQPLTSGPADKFVISWIQTDYYNPIQNMTLHAPQGWNIYKPHGKPATKLPPPVLNDVTVHHVVLLSPEEEFRKAMTVEALAAYIKVVGDTAVKQLKGMRCNQRQQVIIQCDLARGKNAEFKVAMSPSEPGVGSCIKDLYAALNSSKAPESKNSVSFQIVIDVPAKKSN
jgi:hypothetical protein